MDYLSVSEAARMLGVAPKVLSDLLYQRVLSIEVCPLVAGRRLIPRDYLSTVREILRTRQSLPIDSADRSAAS